MSEFLEHDEEASPGIPAALPASERLLWRGAPDWKLLARTRFHLLKLAGYFAAILAVFLALQVRDGAAGRDIVAGAVGYSLLAAVALGLVASFARATARATIFSLTNRRLIVRCGVALPLTMNLPLSKIDSADLRTYAEGFGDIVVMPAADSRASYILLWPFVQPWRLSRVRPMLRAIPNAAWVAETLARALEADAVERALRPPEPVPVRASNEPIAASGGRRKWAAYPTVPLAAAVSLVVVTVLATGWTSLTGGGPESSTPRDVIQSVTLRFEDRDDGSLDVVNVQRDSVIETLEPGTNGFLRSTLRGLERGRTINGEENGAAYSLLRTGTGQLLLVDEVTGQSVDLWAFGKTNAAVFARYLDSATLTADRDALPDPDDEAFGPNAVALKHEERTP